MQSIPGAPYVGEGMDNLANSDAIQGDWNGTLSFWNNETAVMEFKKQFPVNPFLKGTMAHKLYNGGL